MSSEKQDHSRINVTEPEQIAYWTKELGVSPQRLKKLVREHGVMAYEVRGALGKEKGLRDFRWDRWAYGTTH